MKSSKRAVISFIVVVIAVVVVAWLGMRKWEPKTALIIRKGFNPIGDFNNPLFSPSELVSQKELTGTLRREGFADGIGLTDGLPPCAARLIREESLSIKDPDEPRHIRSVSDGKRTVSFVEICGPSNVVVDDESGKSLGSFRVMGHAHSTGCIAPVRGLACGTCAEPERDRRKSDEKPESQVIVYDYRSLSQLGLLKMPRTTFESMAISRDENWLYVGFGDGTIRRFSLNKLFPPPEKKKGWFGW